MLLEAPRLEPALAEVVEACTSLRVEAAGLLFLFLDLSFNPQKPRVKTHCLGLVVEARGMGLRWAAVLCPGFSEPVS